MKNTLNTNAKDLEKELAWFNQIVDARFRSYFKQGKETKVLAISPPNLAKSNSAYAQTIRRLKPSMAERLCLVLALVPHLRPRLLDGFLTANKITNRPFTEFGGIREGSEGDFPPTGETLAFILGEEDLETRFEVSSMLGQDHFFWQQQILELPAQTTGLTLLKAPLRMTTQYLSFLSSGEAFMPAYSINFPAKRISTHLDWKDLVLEPTTHGMLKRVVDWQEHGETLRQDWKMANKISAGQTVMFHGPPGTGKTLAATLIAKSVGQEIYRVSLSSVISKYIGETEKNLATIFDRAERSGWILFFDEADALFGKRTSVGVSNEYANQEVSYLLQRIESHPGLVIVALETKEVISAEISRRFDPIIHFPMPDAQQRLRLWQMGFSPKAKLEERIDLENIAQQYELTGEAILNVIKTVSLQTIMRGNDIILLTDLTSAIREEFVKAGQLV